MSLTPPSDLSLHVVWNHAVHCTKRDGLEVTDANIAPRYARLRELFRSTKGNPFPMPVLPYQYPGVPGLVLRAATMSDIPWIVKIMTERGNYPEDQAPKIVANTVSSPFVWALVLDWQGKPLQYEAIYRGVMDYDSYLAHRVHVSRARPHWFWKEAERPVWEALIGQGVKSMGDQHRVNREHWLDVTKKLYGAEVVKQDKGYYHLRMPVTTSIFQGWPERRTAGDGWSYVYKSVTFREMRSSELAGVKKALSDMFRGMTGGDRAAQILEERYLMDRASVLLGYVAGKLKFVRIARERADASHANAATLNPVWISPESQLAVYVTGVWLEALGYTKASTFLLDSQYKHPAVQDYLTKYAGHLIHHQEFQAYDGVMHELVTDLDALTKHTVDEWMAR